MVARRAAELVTPRFEILRDLGRGGMGHVELVRDRASGELFACKRLTRFDAARAAALKREYRLVGGLVHPNLVRQYELGEDERGLYLLMEVVDGVDLVAFCGGRIGASLALALALPQLLAALRFLHQRGLAHGDLSPANVLVRRDGRLKLLDFGLSAALDGAPRAHGGTAGYLAPERLRGAPPSAEGDRFALGALLAHAAPGRLPGGALDRAVHALRHPSPERRPPIEALERDLLAELGATPPERRRAAGAPLRRDGLEARTLGTVLGRPGELIVLRGPSGIGKTTLARAVSARAAETGLSVAWARARPEERVPFNLIDPLVDDLVERLSREPAPAGVRAAAARAAASFPALFEIAGRDAHAERVRRAVHAELFGGAPKAPSRASLFEDLCVLLEAVDPSAPGRLLVLDDLQWADADSRAFVRAFLDQPPRRTSLLATAVSADGWQELGAVVIDVPPLPPDEVSRYLEVRRGLAPERARHVAATCRGLPALVELALRAGPESADPLGDAVRSVVRDGEADEKRALAMLLVASAPLTAAECDASLRILDLLARRGLVARTGARVDLRHDALREPLRAALGPDWLRAAHERRAERLLRARPPDAELVRQLHGAGRIDEAVSLARRAAEDAERRRAYDLAAELHAVVLEREPTLQTRVLRADALERAQRFDEAAAEWAELARRARGEARARLHLAEAHALLAARRIADGRARIDAALEARGERALGRGRAGRVSTLARFLVGPLLPLGRVPGWPGVPAPAALERAEDRLRSAALIGYFDTIAGLEFLLQARDGFHAGGAAEQAAWCELLLAFFARFGHPRGRSLSLRYRRAAARRLEGVIVESPIVRSFPEFLRAYDALRDGEFRHAITRFDRVLDATRDSREARSFEVQLTTSLRTSAVLATQRVDDAEAAVAAFETFAREGVTIAMQCHVETARALVRTWRGRFELAVESMERLRASWPAEPLTVQAILIEVYSALPSVLLGDAVRARARLRAALERGRRFAIEGTAYGPIVGAVAAATELAAHHAGGRATLGQARRWARLAASRPSVLTGLGHRVLAALDALDGRHASARARLLHAEREARRLDQSIDFALARFARGRREGRASLEADARAALADACASERLLVETTRLRLAVR